MKSHFCPDKGYTVGTEDLALTAVWTEGVTVTLNANGGIFDDGKAVFTDFVEPGTETDLYNYKPQNPNF